MLIYENQRERIFSLEALSEPVHVSRDRLHQKPAQFNIYCKGKCFMNKCASRLKIY